MKRTSLPRADSGSYAMLIALRAGPATFYQLCERAGFDINVSGVEPRCRQMLDRPLQVHVHLVGILYLLTPAARADLDSAAAPAPYVGQVAAPHHRGAATAMPVTIIRRPTPSHGATA